MKPSFASKAFLCISIIMLATAGVAWHLTTVAPEAVALYHALRASSEAGDKAPPVIKGGQHRTGICKRFFFSEEGGRRQMLLESGSSDIIFTYDGHKGGAIEQLSDIRCAMQEELFHKNGKPMQRIRAFEADNAIYDYGQDLFKAQRVTIARYIAPSHQLPPFDTNMQTTMQGRADSVRCSIASKKTAFQAHHLSLTLFSPEGLL